MSPDGAPSAAGHEARGREECARVVLQLTHGEEDDGQLTMFNVETSAAQALRLPSDLCRRTAL